MSDDQNGASREAQILATNLHGVVQAYWEPELRKARLRVADLQTQLAEMQRQHVVTTQELRKKLSEQTTPPCDHKRTSTVAPMVQWCLSCGAIRQEDRDLGWRLAEQSAASSAKPSNKAPPKPPETDPATSPSATYLAEGLGRG